MPAHPHNPSPPRNPLEEVLACDTINPDLFRLKDHSLLDSASLSDPELIAAEIANDLRSALEQIGTILADLEPAGLEHVEAV